MISVRNVLVANDPYREGVDPLLHVERALRIPQPWNRDAYARGNPLIDANPDEREAGGDERCPACPVIDAAATPEAAAAVTTTVVATDRVWRPPLVTMGQAAAGDTCLPEAKIFRCTRYDLFSNCREWEHVDPELAEELQFHEAVNTPCSQLWGRIRPGGARGAR